MSNELLVMLKLLELTGVREIWKDEVARQEIISASLEMGGALPAFGGEEHMVSRLLLPEMDGTPKQVVFADHATSFGPATANDLRITSDGTKEQNVQMGPASLANGSYWQSKKFDLTALHAGWYRPRLCVELAATPTAGSVITMWGNPSVVITDANGNVGGCSGSDAAYTGINSNAAASVKLLELLSIFVLTADPTTAEQRVTGGDFAWNSRYGSIVILNGAGSAFTSDVEFHIVWDPITPEGQ